MYVSHRSWSDGQSEPESRQCISVLQPRVPQHIVCPVHVIVQIKAHSVGWIHLGVIEHTEVHDCAGLGRQYQRRVPRPDVQGRVCVRDETDTPARIHSMHSTTPVPHHVADIHSRTEFVYK